MSGEKSRFTSDRRPPSKSTWAGEGDWAVGVSKNVEVVDGRLVGRTPEQPIESFDGVVLDDWGDGLLTSDRDRFNETKPAIVPPEAGLYGVESRPVYSVESGSPLVDNGRLYLPNAQDNGHQRVVSTDVMNGEIDTTNMEWEFTVERTRGSNNSAEFGMWLDSESDGAVFLTYEANNDDDARLRYWDGDYVYTEATVLIASGSTSGTNHWRVVKEGDDWQIYLDGTLEESANFNVGGLEFNGVWFSNGDWLMGNSQNYNADIWVDNFYANPF